MPDNRYTGLNTPFVIEAWRDNTSSSARAHKFGPLREIAAEAKAAGQPSLIKGLLILMGFVGMVWGLAVML